MPEGLPLAVTISLAYSVMRMLEENNLVRHLGAAEAMATVNVICTDKTGTLTQNRMAVTGMWLAGESVPNVRQYMAEKDPLASTNSTGTSSTTTTTSGTTSRTNTGGLKNQNLSDGTPTTPTTTPIIDIGSSLDVTSTWATMTADDEEAALAQLRCPALRTEILQRVDPGVLRLLCQGININSTANVFLDRKGKLQESGNRTEIALLQLSQALETMHEDKGSSKSGMNIVAQAPFTSERKRMTTVVAIEDNLSLDFPPNEIISRGRIFIKGAAEIVLDLCPWRLDSQGGHIPLSQSDRESLLSEFSGGGLRLLCLAYRDVPITELGSQGFARGSDDESWCGETSEVESLEHDFILISLVALEDPLRPEAAAAIKKCQRAGIEVKMLTGDNAGTAANIAAQCGILPPKVPDNIFDSNDGSSGGGDYGGVVSNKEESNGAFHPVLGPYSILEGQEFRSLILDSDGNVNQDAFIEIWSQLKVLARCTPADKFTIVTGVRALTSDRVAMTGDGTNDAPALRAANVGFAMNSGTQVAKDAADIVLLDDNFSSIVVAGLWGRNVYANVAKFLQFQLTINVVAVLIAVGGAIGASESPLSAVQMLWVNLIMDSLASLALATEAPTQALLDFPPFTESYQFLDPRKPMLKHVAGQAVYQLGVLVWLLLAAPAVLDIPFHIVGQGPSLHHTLVFNSFVMMQLFNQLNSRQVSDSGNVLDGLVNAPLFLWVLGAEALLQAGIVQWGGEAFSTVPLGPEDWALCLGFGAASLIIGQMLRKVPHEALANAVLGKIAKKD